MPIVSISLTEEILKEIDSLQKNLGFSGRSDAIRAGIRSFVSEEKQKEDLSGNVNAILLVVHNDEYDNQVNERKRVADSIKKHSKDLDAVIGGQISIDIAPVSYTHLTLPTKA